MIKSSSRLLVALSLGIAAALMPTHVMAKKPNILLILVDDMGYSDIDPFGGEMPGFRAVRKGDFKLVWLPAPFGNDDWQLYDLSKDPVELNDLSKEQPTLRKEMIEIWNQYSKDVGVILPSGGAMRLDFDK